MYRIRSCGLQREASLLMPVNSRAQGLLGRGGGGGVERFCSFLHSRFYVFAATS
jgi:hypothetical protein